MLKIKNTLVYLLLSTFYFSIFSDFLLGNIFSAYTIITGISFVMVSIIFLYNRCEFDKQSINYIIIISLILPALQNSIIFDLNITYKIISFICILSLIYSNFIKVFPRKYMIIPVIQIFLFLLNNNVLTIVMVTMDIVICLYCLIKQNNKVL